MEKVSIWWDVGDTSDQGKGKSKSVMNAVLIKKKKKNVSAMYNLSFNVPCLVTWP